MIFQLMWIFLWVKQVKQSTTHFPGNGWFLHTTYKFLVLFLGDGGFIPTESQIFVGEET